MTTINVTPGVPRETRTVAYAATTTIACATIYDLVRIIASGDLVIAVPTGGVDGNRLEIWVTASGGARNLSCNAAIVIPTSSSITWPQSVASGKKAKLLLEYDATLNGGQWELTSFVNGY